MSAFEKWLRVLLENPVFVQLVLGFVVTYVLLSFSRWPPPKNPILRRLWLTFVDALFLTADKWGGELRLPFSGQKMPSEVWAEREATEAGGSAASRPDTVPPPTPRNDGGTS